MILWERFDSNEWFVMTMLVLSYGAMWLMQSRLPRSVALAAWAWGFASSTLVDFSIGGGLYDYYRINDTNRYELTDLLVYFMFAPFGYFFIYFYEVLKITRRTVVLYILGWTAVGVGIQWVAEQMRTTQYQQGYRMEFNVVVFLAVQTITALVYMYVKKHHLTGKPYAR